MDHAAFFAAVRPLFGGSLTQAQVDGIYAILEAWIKAGDGNPRHLAYILATAKHETANTMQPVRETLASTDAKAKELLTKAWKAGKLPQVKTPYWTEGFFGRGFVQLTHRDNYERAGKKLGLDLVGNPSKAMIPEVAALILVRGMLEGWFTGRTLEGSPNDFVEARRVVNGTDRAVKIAGYAYSFLNAINGATGAAEPPATPQQPVPAPEPAGDAPKPSTRAVGIIGWAVAIAVAAAGIVAGLIPAWQWITGLF